MRSGCACARGGECRARGGVGGSGAYWRERNREVDFVVRKGGAVTAIEVRSGRARGTPPGMAAFADAFRPTRLLLVGDDGIAVEEFLSQPVEHWV